ncbi:hypothetical protein GPECTOR_8g69 [Gonium pectorale]|uniref:Uncharacterized protein n=1 Tax=Gonium pectorale TaxID=33097 RepID=A0A150GT83_GONPE|nr:hypothetical protein GPECTOR_8g69 [Gonium pectorale]|eukprot:KXZ53076.1 hypothetical protein GPECTOR_8g69 [Gonium pectorale]
MNPALALALRRATPRPLERESPVTGSGDDSGSESAPAAARAVLVAGAAAASTAAGDVPAKKQCLRCCSAPATVGVLHGRSVHLCLCADCVPGFAVGDPCPRCGVPAASVLRCILA